MSDAAAKPLQIDYFSDVLCVWAWIAQRRVAELEQHWQEKITLKYHYLDIFADVQGRMDKQWAERGAYSGFAQHVRDAAKPYDSAPVNAEIWQQVRPKTSSNAHLVLKATQLHYGETASAQLATQLREAFFLYNRDIGLLSEVIAIAQSRGHDPQLLRDSIEDGSAIAALSSDYQYAQQLGIKGSPSWVMNNARQTLYGNVGYRVLNANIEELLKKPQHEASWC